jgi:hypothetical protein
MTTKLGGSQPGSLRGIALDERNNRLYITDYGEQLLDNNFKFHGLFLAKLLLVTHEVSLTTNPWR